MVSPTKPFAFYENQSPKGLDVDVIKTFARKYKLEVNFFEANETFKEVFSTAEHTDTFLKSIESFYYQESLTWCVQQRKPIPIWKHVFHLCKDPLVYTVFFLECCLILFIVSWFQQWEPKQRGWDMHQIFFDGFRGMLGLSMNINPKHFTFRMGFWFYLVCSMLFSIHVSTFLIKVKTNPILGPQVHSIQEIIDGEFTLVGDQFTLRKISQENQSYPMRSLDQFKMVYQPSDYIDQLEWNDKLAVALSRELSRSPTGKDNDSSLKIYCFEHPNNIYEYPLKVLMHKKFSYAKELNTFIRFARECGLIDKWLKEYLPFVKPLAL
ncbi:uncharacterized protein LOC116347768 [Contarinia nasturtii]|uniref:uncharacterized protein LOC116347768 n=1 Tax=Contarinia nasturtii TaxID=265458 RepID=UPI0012D37B84|nr:uncharacterized protein LOC116347768 [Contarinia nasturtii]